MDAWGLNTDSMTYDQWDYQHITTWNFLPFVLRRMGAAPAWVLHAAFTVWGLGIGFLAWSLAVLRGVCMLDAFDGWIDRHVEALLKDGPPVGVGFALPDGFPPGGAEASIGAADA